MDSLNTVTAWSYGLAGVGYAFFALRIGIAGPASLRRRALLAALTLTAVWGFLGLAFALSQAPPVLAIGGLFDVLRMGGWFAFLLSLILRPEAEPAAEQPPRTTWLAPMAAILVGAGLLAQGMLALRVEAFGDPGRFALISALSAAVLGLVLVEQLFRNVPEDFRWNIKPMCVGLGGAFIFDIYLFAEALLFNRIDADVFSVRGFVYTLAMPLVAVSTMRSRDWTLKIALSRQVVFHSAALMATGVYLLMMAGAGYYARFFGGEWGRALQIAVLFAALLLLGLLLISGSMRAKLRVTVSKHFFSYRYDYRDEWLRFTQALSA
ncbi:MAG: XrtA/PEP-CTERM system histidine kinase PrsK, partial [Casimicrobiaceae bacterium]